jgi:hypothetical protein
MNKHIYCAKPMTRTIAEARRVKAAALASKVTTKASLQDSRTSPARATTELLLSGAIGPIHEAHFWTGTHYPSGLARPTETHAPPAGMNWDQWCGPSPARPHHKIYHYGMWDAKAGRFTNDDVANGYVDTPYRKEWDYKV